MRSIVEENAQPGDSAWWGPHAHGRAIEGYSSQPSVAPGGVLAFHVSTDPPARYRIRVFRLGWYEGAGAREVATLPTSTGEARPLPSLEPGTGRAAAGWPTTDRVDVPTDWRSGVYLARLELLDGEGAGHSGRVPFVVRPAPEDEALALVQMPVNTAQAYNHWGGKGLYESLSRDGDAAVKVSFDRPFPAWSEANLNARWPFVYDLPLIRFLEREGIEAAYTTNVDTHRDPSSLLRYRLVITSGHDEYWTREMRDAFEAAAAAGVNLAVMGANTAYWQIRYEDDERTIVEYRSARVDPHRDAATKTVRFRDLADARPESSLLGVRYDDGMTTPSRPLDYHVVSDSLDDPWMRETGFSGSATLPGLVGYEWDAIDPSISLDGLTAFFHADDPRSNADAVRHRLPSGAHVFSAGSLQFSWGLDDWGHGRDADERLQRFMLNALGDLLGVGPRTAPPKPLRKPKSRLAAGGPERSFWQSPVVLAAINRRVSGDPEVSPEAYFVQRYCAEPIEGALRIGPTDGLVERRLLELGAVRHFTVVDAETSRVERIRDALPASLRDSVTQVAEPLEGWRPPHAFGLAVLRGVTHRIRDSGGTLDAVAAALRPGALVYVDEYVGPANFQFPDHQLEAINRLLLGLPDHLRVDVVNNDGSLREPLVRPPAPESTPEPRAVERLLAERFDPVEIRPVGGGLYHQLFNRIMGNFNGHDDLVRLLMEFDALLTDIGPLEADYLWGVYRVRG